MVKKVFVGVFLAIVFGLLVFGAANRTLAKNDESEPLALSKNFSEGDEDGKPYQNRNQFENRTNESTLNQYGQDHDMGSSDCDGEHSEEGYEFNRGSNGQENRSGNAQGGQPNEMQGEGFGIGLAEVDEQITLNGTVVSMSPEILVIELADGSLLEVEGRVLSFLNEKGFSLSSGDDLKITGFYEGDSFEVIQITNDGSGQTIRVRDQNGRPLWAGGRQNGGGND